MYMTLIHWIAIAVFVLLFLLLSLLALKEQNKKTMWGMIFSSFLVTSLACVVALFVIEKYTKKAKILSYTHKRNLANETIMFQGKIQNLGNFKIGYCTIEVKLSNNAMKMGRPKESFFKPSTDMGPLFSPRQTQAPVVKEEFRAVKNLDAKKIKNFRIYMKYPPYMKAPGLKLKLTCH